jgi:hypothetical protein
VLSRGQVEEFAARGFLVLPRVVPEDAVAAAARAIDQLIEREPPGADVRGPVNYFPEAARAPELAALLTGSPAFGLAEALTGPGTLVAPWQVQVALNIPPFPHRPGMHHIDGFPPGPDAGNLWVWPGTHLTHAAYFREHGPDAFFAAGGYPPIRLSGPEQVTGEPGDLLLAHYLLGHNIGGNTSPAVRRAVYYRIKRTGHDPRWREFLTDPWLDYDEVRALAAP